MLALVWRNIWRNPGRSLLSLAAVALAVFFTLIYLALLHSLENGLYANATEAVGHLVVQVAGHGEKRALRDRLIPQADRVGAELQKALPEAQVVLVLEAPAVVAGERRSRAVLLTGAQRPKALEAAFARRHLLEGRLPGPEDLEGIALGRALAQALRVRVGDPVYVYAPGAEGRGVGAYRLVGLVGFPDAETEAHTALLSLAALQALAAPGSATRIELHLPWTRYRQDARLEALASPLRAQLPPGLTLETWREANPALAQVLRLLRPLILLVAGVFFGLAGLLVVNTIYLGLVERTRELGLILALGAGPAQVLRMVLLESLLLSGTGLLLGGTVGGLLVAALARGVSLGALYGRSSLPVLGLPEVIYPSLEPMDLLLTLAFVLITALLAAWWPARVAARLEPVQAMRFVA